MTVSDISDPSSVTSSDESDIEEELVTLSAPISSNNGIKNIQGSTEDLEDPAAAELFNQVKLPKLAIEQASQLKKPKNVADKRKAAPQLNNSSLGSARSYNRYLYSTIYINKLSHLYLTLSDLKT